MLEDVSSFNFYFQEFSRQNFSEEKSKNFPTEMLPPGLLVVHDAPGGGEDNKSELSGRQKVVSPLLNISDGDVKPGRDYTTLVQTTSQIDNDFSSSMIVHNLKGDTGF